MSLRTLPRTLAVLTLASCGPTPPKTCVPEKVATASVVTYQCTDGRTCGPARTMTNPDGGADLPADPYQLCPGENGCALLVSYDGASKMGYC